MERGPILKKYSRSSKSKLVRLIESLLFNLCYMTYCESFLFRFFLSVCQFLIFSIGEEAVIELTAQSYRNLLLGWMCMQCNGNFTIL